MTEHAASVGQAVRQAREARGISLRRAAAELGVSPATLSAVERGRTPMTLARLHELADLLGVPAARLLAGQGAEPDAGDDAAGGDAGRPGTDATSGGAAGQADAHGDWRDFSGIDTGPILEAATRVFVRRGFHAAGMREVAAEAGLSVAGVYHHYPSKQQLLAALLDVTMDEIGWRIAAARDEGHDPVESFSLMVEALALFHAVRGDLAFLGASEMRGLEGEERKRVVALRDGVQHALDAQARVCLDAGLFTCEDPRTAGRAIATMCTALPSWFRLHGPLTPQQVARQYAAYALALMGAAPVAERPGAEWSRGSGSGQPEGSRRALNPSE
ncbi:TetR family transcriptional regulator [Nocardioides solisilvae]|uniref:TetR family transcriptional regulator n=1 Tax=Nocardioides solisilvae TaxID=1542435 RepID=UPI000D748EAF|nr:TetR family transcriptional regulator [Nocardioides solisilvae]